MDVMSASGQKFYEDEEAEQILRVAAQISGPEGRMSRDRLLETAAELGISAEAVEIAERQVVEQRRDQGLRAKFDAKLRTEFLAHLVSYVIVNGCMIATNLLTSPGYFWAMWPLAGWTIGLFCHARVAFFKAGDCYEEEFAQWQERREDPMAAREDNIRRRSRPNRVVVGVHVGGRRRSRPRRYGINEPDRFDG